MLHQSMQPFSASISRSPCCPDHSPAMISLQALQERFFRNTCGANRAQYLTPKMNQACKQYRVRKVLRPLRRTGCTSAVSVNELHLCFSLLFGFAACVFSLIGAMCTFAGLALQMSAAFPV